MTLILLCRDDCNNSSVPLAEEEAGSAAVGVMMDGGGEGNLGRHLMKANLTFHSGLRAKHYLA